MNGTPDPSADPSKQGSTTDTSKFDPEEKIDDFDWDQINRNFEEEMQKRKTEELGLFDEMEQLMAYFNVWSETMHQYDNNRAAKRLKTRITKVQYSEEKLEEKRQHYIKVKEAFQSALRLLNT